MKKYLALALALSEFTASAASFTPAYETHFKNQCKDIMSDIMVTLNELHPNPRVAQMDTIVDRIPAALSPISYLQLGFVIHDPRQSDTRYPWIANKGKWHNDFVSFRWSEDYRTLSIVVSEWNDQFFERVDNGETLKDAVIYLGVFSNIRCIPIDSELVNYKVTTDFPAVYQDKINIYTWKEDYTFRPYVSHKGARYVDWDLWLNPDQMHPPFHGWFTWHEKNQMLALEERWPNLGIDFGEYVKSPKTKTPTYHNNHKLAGDATLTVRTTRRKHYAELYLKAQIEFDSSFLVYRNMKRWNPSSLSYRTSSYRYNECALQFSNGYDLVTWLNENGDRGDEAQATFDKPWHEWIALENYATERSATRERFAEDVRHVGEPETWQE